MKKNRDVYAVLISAAIFTLLFFKKPLGINLLIYELSLLAYLLASKKYIVKNLYTLSLGLGVILTSIFTVWSYTNYSYFVNFLTVFVFVGVVTYPEVKSIINALSLAIVNLVNAQFEFIKKLTAFRFKNRNLGSILRKGSMFFIPVLIILLFIFMYSSSNPIFDNLFSELTAIIKDSWLWVFKDFNFLMLLTFLLGIFFSTFILIHKADPDIVKTDKNASENLQRIRKKRHILHLKTGLLNEYKAGVFLFTILNLMLLTLNIIDIKWVWFGFNWEGQYLKQFVHEGTYMLIFSILVSAAIVLYYFRDNLNFLGENKMLKYLSYAWLLQNALLVISVAIRNIWYVKYFALAYKRIGVFIFLLLVLYGLFTVFVKVREKKSSFYLFKSNAFSVLMVLIITSFFNWDSLIARYNFAHSDQSFVHLNFLSSLSDKSLPYLDKSLEELNKIDSLQQNNFSFEREYMSPEDYHQIIIQRKYEFRTKWKNKGALSWNWPEYLAYKKLYREVDY